MKRSRGTYIEFETVEPFDVARGIRATIAGAFAFIAGGVAQALREAVKIQTATPVSPRGRGVGRGTARKASPRSSRPRARATQRRLPADVEHALSVLALPESRLPSPDRLRRARNAAILNAHPDRGGSNAAAARVNEAYRIVAGAIPQS